MSVRKILASSAIVVPSLSIVGVLLALLSLFTMLGAGGATGVPLHGAPATAPAGNDPFDLSLWQVEAEEYRVEPFRGREALWLNGGGARLVDSDFTNGIIELDIAVSEVAGFAGVFFRDDGAGNFEHFYIRSHLSGKPDATQYQPVFNDISGWQIYAGPRFNAPVEMVFDRWMHLKIVVSGTRAEIYLDSDEPVFVIPHLVEGEHAGAVGIAASSAPARFANFSVREMSSPPMTGAPGAEPEPVSETLVRSWSVSAPFPESLLEGRFALDEGIDDTGPRLDAALADGWQRLEVGERGIANLARLHGIEDDRDTVIAALTIDAQEALTIPARFGFSDRVHVYLNGRLLFAGDDGWRTRDYRFLGTIGLFDEVYLPLREGANELFFAVSEGFGGWGVMLDLPDRSGVRAEPARRPRD